MEVLRLFVALDFPQLVKEQIKVLQKDLQKSGADVKWVDPKNLHLTLKFLGDTPENLLSDINDALLKAAEKAFPLELILQELGIFPKHGEPRVLWVGIRERNNHLVSLAKKIDTNLSALGIPREHRTFSPHLTLGRIRSQAGAQRLQEQFTSHQLFGPLGPIKIADFQLLKSELTPKGPIYNVLQKFKIPVCI